MGGGTGRGPAERTRQVVRIGLSRVSYKIRKNANWEKSLDLSIYEDNLPNQV